MKSVRRFAPQFFLLGLTLLFFGGVLRPIEAQAVGGLDMRALFYPWLEWVRGQIFSGQSPFWDASRFVGYPFLHNPQVAIFYPPTWLAILFKPNFGITLYLIFHVWMAGVGMFLFVREEATQRDTEEARRDTDRQSGLHPSSFILYPSIVAGLVAAVVWMFSGFVAARIFAGHIGLLATHVWLGWLLWVTGRALRTWSIWRVILVGVPLALAILAGHTTSLLYIGLVWLFYTLCACHSREGGNPFFLKDTFRAVSLVAIAGIVALLLSGVQLLPLVQFAELAGRSADTTLEFASRFSMPPRQLISLLWPQFFGEPVRVGYQGAENFEELTYFVGRLPLLAIPAAIILRVRGWWFWVGVIVLGVLLGIGSNGFLFETFYNYVPGFRLARAPARAMVLYSFGASVLAGLFVAEVGIGWTKKRRIENGELRIANGRLLTAYCLLFTVLLFDLWGFGRKLVRQESIVPSGLWFVSADLVGDHQRVLPWGVSIFEQNGAGQVGLDSVFGYNALEVGRLSDLFRVATDPRSKVYDLLGADVVVAESEQAQFTTALQFADGLVLRGEQGGVWVYDRPNHLPLVRLVEEARPIPQPDQAVAALLDPSFNPSTTAIVNELPCEVAGGGEAEIEARADGYWLIRTSAEQPSLLVVSETAFPGWRVTIDGERAEWVTAYGALRAVCVPAGEHLVEWRFVPTIFAVGGLISAVGLALTGVAYRQSKRPNSAPHS